MHLHINKEHNLIMSSNISEIVHDVDANFLFKGVKR